MAGRQYAQVIEGEWLDWNEFERWQCCGCSLVHRVETRTYKGKLQARMFVDNRSTGQIRRFAGIKVTRTTKKVS